jgi:hypothetical protein
VTPESGTPDRSKRPDELVVQVTCGNHSRRFAAEAASVSLVVVLDHVPVCRPSLKNDLVAAVGGQEGNL